MVWKLKEKSQLLSTRICVSRRQNGRVISWKVILFTGILAGCAAVQQFVMPASLMSSRYADERPAAIGEPQTEAAPSPGGAGHTAGTAEETHSGEAAAHTSEAHTSNAHADDHGGGHKDPVAEVLLAITIILLAAKVAGDFFRYSGYSMGG